jgi:hypothetical protein
MACRGDEIEKSMDAVIPETRVSLDARFLSEDIIVLAFKISHYFLESEFVVDVVTESRGIDYGQSNTNAIFFQFDVDGFDSDTLLDMRCRWVVRDFVGQDL